MSGSGRSRYESSIIPARFLITLGHLVATLLVFSVRDACIAAGLGVGVEEGWTAANAEITSALAVALMCFILDFTSLFFGFSLFIVEVSQLQILLHFIGGVLTSQLVVEEWSYKTLWYIVGFCNIPTAVAELCVLVAIFVLNVYPY